MLACGLALPLGGGLWDVVGANPADAAGGLRSPLQSHPDSESTACVFLTASSKLPPYLFVEITRKIDQKRAEGVDVITFAIGDPDIPTPQHIMDSLHAAADEPANHRYPESDGLPELRQAVADWYQQRFGADVRPATRKCCRCIGSKEGIANIAYCLIDPGDVALVPDPGYPVYSIGTMFAGGEPYYMPLTRGERLPAGPQRRSRRTSLRRAKVLWLNYPNNPTAAVADLAFFEEAVAFAKKYDIADLPRRPLQRGRLRRLQAGELPRRPRARATSASSSTRCRRATT